MAYRKKRRGKFKKRKGGFKKPRNIYSKRIGRRYGG